MQPINLKDSDNNADDFPVSVSGNRWALRPIDDRLATALSQKHNLHPTISELMARRNVGIDDAENFLNPSIKNHLPDPSEFMDMDKAAKRLAEAVINNQKIVIYGDYDVDGATSSALLRRYFRNIGIEAGIYIPDRIKEGYGPNVKALIGLKEQGVDIVVTVDCGTAAAEILEEATAHGLDIIVIDHHIGSEVNPKVLALVNPNRLDETSPYKYLAAVGVSFMLTVAINRELRKAGRFQEKAEPNLLDLLDLVALGTICDVVPLIGINRAFVSQGLKIIAQRKNLGLAALADIASITEQPTTYHAGFIIGPRINAGGRVGKADLGAHLLSSEDEEEITKIAAELDRLNTERRTLEALILEEAILQAEEKRHEPIIILASEGWHQGIIGIICSRIKDSFKKPVAVISIENGMGKASARSIPGIDIGSAIAAAKMAGILTSGGGHAMAAGFTIEAVKISELTDFLSKRLASNIEKEIALARLYIDGALAVGGINHDFMDHLSKIAPFGSGNHEPVFMLKNVQIVKSDIVGQNHLRCIVSERGSGRSYNPTLKTIAYRKLDTPLGKALLKNLHKDLSLIGSLRRSEWKGNKKIEMIVEDMIAA